MKKAYKKILSLEKENKRLLESEEINVDKLHENVSQQSRIMEKIDSSSTLDERFQNQNPELLKKIMTKFQSIRRQNKPRIEDETKKIESQLDSLDQSVKLMKHYMQGDQRREEGTSLRFDEEV